MVARSYAFTHTAVLLVLLSHSRGPVAVTTGPPGTNRASAGAASAGYPWRMDDWYQPAPAQSNPAAWPQVADSDIRRVADRAWPSAARLLRIRPIVRLSNNEARKLAGSRAPADPGKEPYLVRALYFNSMIGGFSVFHRGRELYVTHSSLGHHWVRMKRTALVVLLRTNATREYVTCTLDE